MSEVRFAKVLSKIEHINNNKDNFKNPELLIKWLETLIIKLS